MSAKVRNELKWFNWRTTDRARGATMFFPEILNFDEIRLAPIYRENVSAGSLAYVNDGNTESDREANPSVIPAKPTKPFKRAAEIQEKYTVAQFNVIGLRHGEVMRTIVEAEDFKCHVGILR
jgi:hypothetical protein